MTDSWDFLISSNIRPSLGVARLARHDDTKQQQQQQQQNAIQSEALGHGGQV